MAGPVVGIDLGGTKIFGALVDPDRPGLSAVIDDAKVSTPGGSAADVAAAVVDVVRGLDARPVAVGVGTPGVVDPGSGRVLVAPNLPGFDEPVDLGAHLSAELGCPVVVANDVNVAAMGEVRFGAAAGATDVLALWMGTGLGGALVLDGSLRVGPSGLAGEIGHTVVVPDGRRCGCGGRGHLEAYIGRRSMEEEARRRHADGEPTMLVDLAGAKPMKSKVWKRAYEDGDAVARALVDEGIQHLGVTVANVALTVDVASVVIGGGLGERFGPLAAERIGHTLQVLRFAGPPPTITVAKLGDHAGALGAAVLAAARR